MARQRPFRVRRLLARGAFLALLLLGVLALLVYLRHGGGRPYPDLTDEPLLGDDALEVVVTSPEPIGNVAVAPDGRVFYTVHPEARPPGPKLWRWTAAGPEPFPEAARQEELFATPLGLVVDRQNRLWVIDPANHGIKGAGDSGTPRLLAFDLASGDVVYDLSFPREVAPRGSFFQDLQVDSRGETVYVADASFWRRSPALVVVDLASRKSRRLLVGHLSIQTQDWLIRTPIKNMVFLGGLASLQVGVDGVTLTRDDTWLYYGAMTNDTLYRLPTDALRNPSLAPGALAARVEAVGPKPLNDGLSSDVEGNVLVTDVEHGAVVRMSADGALETLVRTPRIRWADGLSYGPDGWLYVADSAIPDFMLRSRAHMRERAPYFIYRFRPGVDGVPGR